MLILLRRKLRTHSVHTPPSHPPRFCWGWVEPPTKFSKRGGSLTGPQILEGGDFFLAGGGRGGLQFSPKKMN